MVFLKGFWQYLADLPIRKKLVVVVAVFSFIICMMLGLSYFAMTTLSSVRSYVAGEGFWAKGQKDALSSLTKYATTHDEQDYQRFLNHLSVPIGCMKARVELQKSDIDFDMAYHGYLECRTHPDDIWDAVKTFQRFASFGHFKRAVEVWTIGDGYIVEIQKVGEAIHTALQSGVAEEVTVKNWPRLINSMPRSPLWKMSLPMSSVRRPDLPPLFSRVCLFRSPHFFFRSVFT